MPSVKSWSLSLCNIWREPNQMSYVKLEATRWTPWADVTNAVLKGSACPWDVAHGNTNVRLLVVGIEMTVDLMSLENRWDIMCVRDEYDWAQHRPLRNTADKRNQARHLSPLSWKVWVLSVCVSGFIFRWSFLCVSCLHVNFVSSLFVARYHLKCSAVVYDCYSKVRSPCFTIFCLYKVHSIPQIFSRAPPSLYYKPSSHRTRLMM